jgi:hypothetical protein
MLFSAAGLHPCLEHDERVGLYPPALNSGPSRVLVDDSAPGQRNEPHLDFFDVDVVDTDHHLCAMIGIALHCRYASEFRQTAAGWDVG